MREEYCRLHELLWCNSQNRGVRQAARHGEDGGSAEQARSNGLLKLYRGHGFDEEIYRRIAGVYRTIGEVFPLSQFLLKGFLGRAFYESILREMSQQVMATLCAVGPLEILEPFDGYLVAPVVLRHAPEYIPEKTSWIVSSLEYEWALWHARRVASGWPPQRVTPPLVAGASLVSANYDLLALRAELKRLSRANVDVSSFLERIVPSQGTMHRLVYPQEGSVFEANLDDMSYATLVATTSENKEPIDAELRATLDSIGAVLECSFLCCSTEMKHDAPLPWFQTIVPESH